MLKIIRWFVEGEQSHIRQNVGGSFLIDSDYRPLWVHLSLRTATKGNRPLKIDITDDGTSIFNGTKPALVANQSDKVWTTFPKDVIRENSILKLNRDQIANLTPGEDLTVELALEET